MSENQSFASTQKVRPVRVQVTSKEFNEFFYLYGPDAKSVFEEIKNTLNVSIEQNGQKTRRGRPRSIKETETAAT